jgi:hypothetical protein
MIMPSVIRDIALEAAKREYKTTRMLGGSANEATIAGCKVMLEIRSIASDGRAVPVILAVTDSWWINS